MLSRHLVYDIPFVVPESCTFSPERHEIPPPNRYHTHTQRTQYQKDFRRDVVSCVTYGATELNIQIDGIVRIAQAAEALCPRCLSLGSQQAVTFHKQPLFMLDWKRGCRGGSTAVASCGSTSVRCGVLFVSTSSTTPTSAYTDFGFGVSPPPKSRLSHAPGVASPPPLLICLWVAICTGRNVP